MRRLATTAVGALSTVHAGLDGDEKAIVDSFLNLPCEVNETVEVVARSERVAVMSDSFATLWTMAHQAPLSMGFPREEY